MIGTVKSVRVQFCGNDFRSPPTPALPASGEGVDYCYRGKSLLPKLPAKLKDEFSSLGDFGVRS